MPIRIHSLNTSAGYLKDAPVSFAKGLTCIIGARGTCKSTIVESIRFAFDCNPTHVELLLRSPEKHSSPDTQSSQGLIRATLNDGVVRCEVTQDGPVGTSELTIERDTDSPPRVYRDGVKELSDLSVLHCIEIYSQGDLQRIAEKDNLRLELIDRPHKTAVTSLKVRRDVTGDELKQLGPALRQKRAEIEGRRAQLQGVDALRTQLTELQSQRPSLTQELDREREAFLRRRSVLERLQAAVRTRQSILASLAAALPSGFEVRALKDDLVHLHVPEADSLVTGLEQFEGLVARLRSDLNAAESMELAPLVQTVDRVIEEQNATYYLLRQDQQAMNECLKKEDSLKQQIIHLEKLETELETLLEEERALLERRKSCRAKMQQFSDSIYQLRLQQVEQINSQHNEVILLTLEQGARSAAYADRLATLLQGSRLRNREEVAKDLAENVRPADLIDIVEASDTNRLASILHRDLGQMARLVAFLMDSSDFYELEGMLFEDRLEITMYDGDVPKPVSQLSRGQMATALLPLILRDADYPLVFDQPEDDLDNRFIYTTLVEHIRRLKERRQLIFVTHNANIPVLGEADTIVVMHMEHPTKAGKAVSGSVDAVKQHILMLLEGGPDAFRRRHEKYGELLK